MDPVVHMALHALEALAGAATANANRLASAMRSIRGAYLVSTCMYQLDLNKLKFTQCGARAARRRAQQKSEKRLGKKKLHTCVKRHF
jgi:hypothetical protein